MSIIISIIDYNSITICIISSIFNKTNISIIIFIIIIITIYIYTILLLISIIIIINV